MDNEPLTMEDSIESESLYGVRRYASSANHPWHVGVGRTSWPAALSDSNAQVPVARGPPFVDP